MAATFLMSYPGPDWHIRGAQNFRSESRASTNPRRAMQEWLSLCDAISRAGGRILVMPPAAGPPTLTGMVYTANAGQLFHRPDGWSYLVSRMATPHRQAEREVVAAFLREAGLRVALAAGVWEGQADLQQLPANRFVATWGVRSERPSVDEVRAELPPGARLLELQLHEPFFHGDTCLDPLTSRAGDTLLLVHAGAFVGDGLGALRGFLGERVDILSVDRDDALGYACNSLCVGGTVLAPTGLSTGLRGQLARRGYTLEEIDLPELFGKGGGGPRCLVNELRGLTVNPGAPDYASLRDELHAKAERYPEEAPPSSSSPPPVSAAD
jgi:N-dimethylarginine dimethylaminohydrolase